MATIDVIKKVLDEELEIDASEVSEESTLEMLKIDSLDMVQLIVALEDELGIDFGEPENLNTVGDLVNYIDSL